jgi:hypothetical protein
LAAGSSRKRRAVRRVDGSWDVAFAPDFGQGRENKV